MTFLIASISPLDRMRAHPPELHIPEEWSVVVDVETRNMDRIQQWMGYPNRSVTDGMYVLERGPWRVHMSRVGVVPGYYYLYHTNLLLTWTPGDTYGVLWRYSTDPLV
jgi:hypothetical protein